MATVRKNLAQSALAATTLTDVYVVPGATSAVVSTLIVCNRGTSTTYRLSHSKAGAVDASNQYFAYDVTLDANATVAFTMGICMAATDVIRAYAGSANVTVQLWGEETS